jgi:hypothetical protein
MLGNLRTKLRLFLVVAITTVLVYLLVWPAAGPKVFNDPVSFLHSQNLPLAWVLLAAVAVISTLLTVLICGRRLPDLPVLVFAASLCVLSVRSGEAIRAHWAYGSGASYLSFAVEALLLIILFYGVHLLGKIILTHLAQAKPADENRPRKSLWASILSIVAEAVLVRYLARLLGGIVQTHLEHAEHHRQRQFSLASDLQAFALALVVGFVAAILIATTAKTTIAGVEVYASDRSQIIFAALAAGFLSTLAAHQAFRPARSLFCWIALPLVGFVAYLVLAWLGSPVEQGWPRNPLGNFLPVDFLGPGVLGGMLGLLLSHKLFRNRAEEEA